MHRDSSLLDLFHAEAETHMGVLNEGILALEKDPHQTGRFEALMRAAHSIKGAARIVGLDHAVSLAHVIEDCFVAAREGRITLCSEMVDVLLPAVDMLQRVTQANGSESMPAEQVVKETVDQVRAAMSGPLECAQEPPAAFQPSGALDAQWVLANRTAIAARLESGQSEIVFNLSGVRTIDAAGAALLVVAGRAAARLATRTQLTITGSSPRLRRYLQTTGLDRLYHVVASET